MQDNKPTGQGTAQHSPPPPRRLSKKQIDATVDSVKAEFRKYQKDRPEIARMGQRMGGEFMRVLLEAQAGGALPQDVHQAIQFIIGWMIATSTADATDQRLRDRLVEYALVEAGIYARSMTGTKRMEIKEDADVASKG